MKHHWLLTCPNSICSLSWSLLSLVRFWTVISRMYNRDFAQIPKFCCNSAAGWIHLTFLRIFFRLALTASSPLFFRIFIFCCSPSNFAMALILYADKSRHWRFLQYRPCALVKFPDGYSVRRILLSLSSSSCLCKECECHLSTNIFWPVQNLSKKVLKLFSLFQQQNYQALCLDGERPLCGWIRFFRSFGNR